MLHKLMIALLSMLLTWSVSVTAEEAEKPEGWSVMNPMGEFTKVSIDTKTCTWCSVSVTPDGKTLIFDLLGDIYSMPATGGEAKALTQGAAWDIQPQVSPDGQHIAFISDRDGGENIYIMDLNGENVTAVSKEKINTVHDPAWSADGRYIGVRKGFMSTRSIAAGEVWLYHRGGGGGLQLTERPYKDGDQKDMGEVAFSPDGKYAYFSQNVTPGRVWQYNLDSTGQLYVIKRLELATGEIEVYVSGPGGAIRPTPSPDGKHLAFIRRDDFQSQLWLKNIETGRETMVFGAMERDLQELFGTHNVYPAMDWMPDSEELVFWAKGQFHRLDVDSKKLTTLDMHVKTEFDVQKALRTPVEVAPDELQVKMPRWATVSPDGEQLVFQALGYLWIQDFPEGKPRRLTKQDEHFEFYPSFSRDGKRITYVTWDDQKLGSVRSISNTGRSMKIHTNVPGVYLEPAFSPDGKALVYRKRNGGYLLSNKLNKDPGLYYVNLKEAEHKRISKSGFAPHFGDDAERVYFSSFDSQSLQLHSVGIDGHDKRDHLKGTRTTEFRISPDGRYVAFAEHYRAYVAPFTFTGKMTSIGPKTTAFPVSQVSKAAGEELRWSGDSKQLHWSHGAEIYTRDLKDAFAFIEGSTEPLPEPVAEGIAFNLTVDADKPKGMKALTNARIIPMSSDKEEVIENGVVLVEGNRIKAVGKMGEVEIPSAAEVIDLEGKTVIPGLVDVHAHGGQGMDEITPEQNWLMYSMLGFGVTTVHDPSNDTTEIFAAAEMQKAGEIIAPRIYSTGTILYGAKLTGYNVGVDSIEDARFHVERLKKVGAISVKSYAQPRRDQRQQIIQASREMGIMVFPEGGGRIYHNLNMIVDGHTGIEHSIPIERLYDDAKQMWSQTQVGYSPTLGVSYGGLSGEYYWYDRTDVWRNERLLRWTPKTVINPRAIRRQKAPDEHYNHFNVTRDAKRLNDMGVKVLIGAHGQREGLAAHWEIWMLNQGGMTPWQALRAATIDGAWYIGMDKDLGSIEPGKLADLAIIDGNPLEDIRRSEFVTHTMLNGRLYDAKTMNEIGGKETKTEPFYFHQP